MFAFLLVSLLGSDPVAPAAPSPVVAPVTPEAPAPLAPASVTPEAPAPSSASPAADVPAAPVPVDAPIVKESEPVKEAVAEPVRETAPVTETFSVAQSRYIRRTNGEVVHCAAQQVLTGHPSRQGKWVINYVYTGDPYGFQALINNFRQRMGLRTLSYDPNLSNWAAQNNQAQLSRGMGHHVNPGFRQNAGWNYQNAQHVFQGWLGSPGHRDAMVAANVASFGIHYLNPYWTLNLR